MTSPKYLTHLSHSQSFSIWVLVAPCKHPIHHSNKILIFTSSVLPSSFCLFCSLSFSSLIISSHRRLKSLLFWSPSDTQLEQNARKRRPSISPIVLRQQEQEQRAKMAANAPVDITQVMSKLSKQGKEKPPNPPPPPYRPKE